MPSGRIQPSLFSLNSPAFSQLGCWWIAVWVVSSVDFYLEHQHQLLDLPRHSLLSLPGLIDLEHLSREPRSQPDAFQTQTILLAILRRLGLRRISRLKLFLWRSET